MVEWEKSIPCAQLPCLHKHMEISCVAVSIALTLFKGQNSQKLCLSVILWYPTLQVSFALFTVLNSGFFVSHSIPQNIHSVSNPCNIYWPCFWRVFYWLAANYILK